LFVAELKLLLQGQFENPTTLFRLFNCKRNPNTDPTVHAAHEEAA
jgi:hypothetical protein